MAIVNDEKELELWKKAGKIAAQARDYGEKLIVKGAKTEKDFFCHLRDDR